MSTDPTEVYLAALPTADVQALLGRLVALQDRAVRRTLRARGVVHAFADVDGDRPEVCLCGADFIRGRHLHVRKQAHLAAVEV